MIPTVIQLRESRCRLTAGIFPNILNGSKGRHRFVRNTTSGPTGDRRETTWSVIPRLRSSRAEVGNPVSYISSLQGRPSWRTPAAYPTRDCPRVSFVYQFSGKRAPIVITLQNRWDTNGDPLDPASRVLANGHAFARKHEKGTGLSGNLILNRQYTCRLHPKEITVRYGKQYGHLHVTLNVAQIPEVRQLASLFLAPSFSHPRRGRKWAHSISGDVSQKHTKSWALHTSTYQTEGRCIFLCPDGEMTDMWYHVFGNDKTNTPGFFLQVFVRIRMLDHCRESGRSTFKCIWRGWRETAPDQRTGLSK